jgi:hypothetical protein
MAAEYIANGTRKDVLYLKQNTSARLKAQEETLSGLLLIKVEEWPSMCVDRGDGDEDEYEYGSGAILLNRDDVIALKHRLEVYLKETFKCDREGLYPKCETQCEKCERAYTIF